MQMKIDRLLGITIYLLNHGRTKASVLAEHFEVSTRTIMRDMDTLCLAGIPVSSNFGTDGGFEIMETFEMQRQVAGEIDYSFVVSALQGLASAYHDKELEATLEKMECLSSPHKSSMILDLSVVHENRDTNELLYLLNQWTQKKVRISFAYTNARDEKNQVVVEPVCTIYRWYHWYLIGYSLKHQEYRMYKVARMDHLKTTGEENGRNHNIKEVKEFLERGENQRKRIKARLLCRDRLRSKCREYLGASITKEYDTGEFECEIFVPEDETFWYGVLLSFGGDVRVLEPKTLMERIQKDCVDILENYEKIEDNK
jgi:predicted DNA-binding transcriptional regulator YafY